MAMQDYEKYQNLHTIIMLKDVIRKWWGLELAFADHTGYIFDHANGQVIPPNNDFCRLSLFSKEGFRRCNQSIKYVGEKFQASKKPRRCMFHDCHLDFTIVSCPIVVSGEYKGFIFVGGFVRQKFTAGQEEQAKSKARSLNPGASDLDRAVQRLPILSPAEISKLCDLLEFAADEISAFEAEIGKKESEIQKLSDELLDRYRFDSIVGKSQAIQEVFRLLEKVSNSDSTVMIQGESGTGKELVARAIHFNGPRRDKPFVVQNCSAFNDNLLESALFGHVKGSFTGALRDKKGLFEVADTGTFFLDEIGDMSPVLQVKLLRVLQEGTLTPVGSNHVRDVDVRVIAATHKDLFGMVERGEFREDLYYRINVIKIDVPSLRERKEDIPLLVDHFLKKHSRDNLKKQISADCMSLLSEYHWPGNIRELENEVERLIVLGSGEEILDEGLVSPRIRESVDPDRTITPIKTTGSLKSAVEALEKEIIYQGLIRHNWNKSRLAKELGISRSNLIAKCDRFGLDAPQIPRRTNSSG